MFFGNVLRHAALFFVQDGFLQQEAMEGQSCPVSDISVSYHDMAQTDRRADKFQAEMKKTGRCKEQLTDVIAQKTDQLCSGNGNAVQLEREIDSAAWKLRELERQKKDMETAAFCSRMYGIFGLDYSVSSGRLYYKGKAVRYFADEGYQEGGSGCAAVYQNPDGEVSVTARRGRTGSLLYLKVYGHPQPGGA